MGTIKTRPEPGHITYGCKLVLINLTYGEWNAAKLAELVTKATKLASEKSLPEIELRFDSNNDMIVDAMSLHDRFYWVKDSNGRWLCNVNAYADDAPKTMDLPMDAEVEDRPKKRATRKTKVSA